MAKNPRAQRHRPVPLRDVRELRREAQLQRTKTRHEVERFLRHNHR